MRHFVAAVALLAAATLPATAAAQVSIDFDGTGAPCSFAQTGPLTTQYGAQGVTFGGNGSILNQCSGFPSGAAHSGTDFAAYNAQVRPASESITFSAFQNYFDIYIGSTSFATLTFYQFGNPFAIFVVPVFASGWSEWTFGIGYDRVDIQSGTNLMTLDDLSTQPVVVTPEPASMTLFATGLLGLGALVRRRRNQAA